MRKEKAQPETVPDSGREAEKLAYARVYLMHCTQVDTVVLVLTNDDDDADDDADDLILMWW